VVASSNLRLLVHVIELIKVLCEGGSRDSALIPSFLVIIALFDLHPLFSLGLQVSVVLSDKVFRVLLLLLGGILVNLLIFLIFVS